MLIATKFKKFHILSTHSIPNIIFEMNNPECLMRRPSATNGSSYYMAHALWTSLAQEHEIFDAWVQALKDSNGKDAKILD